MPLHVVGRDRIGDALITERGDQPIEDARGLALSNGGSNPLRRKVGANIVEQARRAGKAADAIDEKGIQAGKLEFREGAVWGNPYLRVLRSQLEPYIAAPLGSEYLVSRKSQTELRAVNKEIAHLRQKLAALEARKTALERAIKI